jgi:hypothetical protein
MERGPTLYIKSTRHSIEHVSNLRSAHIAPLRLRSKSYYSFALSIFRCLAFELTTLARLFRSSESCRARWWSFLPKVLRGPTSWNRNRRYHFPESGIIPCDSVVTLYLHNLNWILEGDGQLLSLVVSNQESRHLPTAPSPRYSRNLTTPTPVGLDDLNLYPDKPSCTFLFALGSRRTVLTLRNLIIALGFAAAPSSRRVIEPYRPQSSSQAAARQRLSTVAKNIS